MTTELTAAPSLERILEWVTRHQRLAITIGAAVVVLAGGVWFALSARARREAFATRALTSARSAADAGNLPLAANDLSRLINAYGGTAAAEEATLLLAQVRLLQNQAPLAVADLRTFVAGRPSARFAGPAYALLGGALEEQGQFGEAAQAYESAVDAYPYDAVKAQFLLDAARTYRLAGDTAQAARRYERLTVDFKDQPAALEAKLRLAELRAAPIPR